MSEEFKIGTLFDLEKEGRELATKIQTSKPSTYIELSVPREVAHEIIDSLRKYKDLFGDLAFEFRQAWWRLSEEDREKIMLPIDMEGDIDGLERIFIKTLTQENFIIPDMDRFVDILYQKLYRTGLRMETLADDLAKLFEKHGGTNALRKNAINEMKRYARNLLRVSSIVRNLHRENRLIRKKLVKPDSQTLASMLKYLNKVEDTMDLLIHMLTETASRFSEMGALTEEMRKKIDKLVYATELIKDLSIFLRERLHAQKVFGTRAFAEPEPLDVEKEPIYFITPLKHITIKDVYQQLSKILGRPVGYMWRVRNVLSWSALINDLANAVHVLAEELEKTKILVNISSYGKCYAIGENPDSRGVELCRLWDEYTEENHRKGLYIDEDYGALTGTVYKNRVSLRVGSAEGHATDIEFKDDTLSLTYYDTDYDVNNEIYKMLESCGCKCELEDWGVECTCRADDKTIDCIAKTLSLATSMDIRLREEI